MPGSTAAEVAFAAAARVAVAWSSAPSAAGRPDGFAPGFPVASRRVP